MTRGTNSAGDKGTSGQNVPKSPKGLKNKKSKFRMESEQEKISKSKLRMETREDKLNRARKKLEGKKPPKPRGPVRRVLGAAGWNAHGFVHGKVYEVEHENVGTEGAHRSELLGEAALRHGTRYAKKRIREHPARAVHKAEAQYIKARADYQFRMAAQENPDYDEYHFDLDAIEHDPYVLISLLSAWHEGEWTLADVQPTLRMLFDRQYTLTENVVKERRYYIETDTWTDEDGNTHTDSYRVYYDYFICYVTLDNFNLSHLPIYIMGEDKVSRYSLYMATLGNRPDLFPGSSYVGKYTSPPEGYEVPGEYLDDETFAAMLSEAEKFLGYPYVWGGSSPATSFDCSGFVSWVVNHSGWNVGRLGAQGLYNICTRTSSPRPGDLVFFKGTYDTPGVSHCGIYVGDGMMIHCCVFHYG